MVEKVTQTESNRCNVRVTAMFFAVVLTMTAFAGWSSADIVFTVVQKTPIGGAALPLGDTNAGLFDIFIHSTIADQSFLGCDFTLNLSSTNGTGGRMVAGLNILMPDSSNPDGFIPGTFDAPGTASATYSTIPNQPLILDTSDTLLARVTLSTVNAIPGDYAMSLAGLDAVDGVFNQIDTSSAGELNYSVVPEPTSIVLVGLGFVGLAWRARRKLSLLNRS